MKYLALLLISLFLLLEYTIGIKLENEELAAYTSKTTGLKPSDYYLAPAGKLSYPEGDKDVHTLIYLSNSHAKTGGHVAKHLQSFLNNTPELSYRVLDMSEPGIFAPEILERLCASLAFKPDSLVLSIAYISLADRMLLKRQSHTARSFFRPEVRKCLPISFWTRNYDIGLFTDTLFAHSIRLYRYRDKIRKYLEAPVANAMKSVLGNAPVHILESDVNKKWQFPDGFDRNLFDWSLYASGRKNQLADLRATIETANEHDVKTYLTNLPIHWKKDPHKKNLPDVRLYRKQVAEIGELADEYVDYQHSFPEEFSTYDALHPTYHGARLHAYELYLRITGKNARKLSELSTDITQTYYTDLERCQSSKLPSFIRYDIFERKNAQELLCALRKSPFASAREARLQKALTRRILYWETTDFPTHITDRNVDSALWSEAIASEFSQARQSLSRFKSAFSKILAEKYKSYPTVIPEKSNLVEENTVSMTQHDKSIELIYSRYKIGSVNIDTMSRASDRKVFAIKISPIDGTRAYIKYDILADESFISTDLNTSKLLIPEWIFSENISPEWGI